MKFKHLLAKSLNQELLHSKARKATSYTGHIVAVMQSADVLIQELGTTILQQLGLESIDPNEFGNTVRLGAYLHDWGKANQHFQEMVRLKSKDERINQHREKLKKSWREHGERQMLRHEVLSGILALQVPSFREWLEQCPSADLMVAVWAAMGHHLKIGLGKDGKPAGCVAEIPDGTGDGLEIYTHHGDFRAVLKMGRKFLGLPDDLPELPEEHWSKCQLKQALTALRDEFVELEEQMDWERQKFIAAVKATVIAADLAGSAIPVTGHSLKEWIQQVLALVLSDADIEQLLNQRLEDKPLRPFQQQIAQSPKRVTLVRAGCGTGKTVGAYAWAKKWAVGRKLFFGYPTTGTASQGYIDYAAETKMETTLMHSRAEIDLEEILFSGDSDDSEGIDARLAAFSAWQAKLIVCTVDSVLGLIQNNRKPLYSWPAISQSAFVFDEVHAYDERLFGALLRFIKTFRGAPILLMSASFSQKQLEVIQQVMDELGEELHQIPGPDNLEVLPRYRIQSFEVSNPDELSEIWPSVLEALEKKQKVLWVTNSVQSCINLYRLAETQISLHLPVLPIKRLIYHSRYRYKDRLQKHKAVVEAFKADEPVLAITTQVCEMSLDLSADLLVSAMAPAAALIQRLGRLNRRVIEDENGKVCLTSGRSCTAIIYPWNQKQPYEPSELLTGQQLVNHLAGAEISQQDLSKVAAQFASNTPTSVESEWLEGHWCTHPGFLREAGYTITVLLEQDKAAIRQSADNHKKSFTKEAQRWSVPIRIIKGFQQWKRIGFYPVAPPTEIRYSEETGAEPCK